MNESERKKLGIYSKKPDRASEPVYVGGDAYFNLVKDNYIQVQNGEHQGLTICLTGPPGAGKSAFLIELKKRCDSKAFGDGKVHCVILKNKSVYAPGYVMAEIAEQVHGFKLDRVDGASLSNSSIHIIGAGAGIGWTPPPPDIRQDSYFPKHHFRIAAKDLIEKGHMLLKRSTL